MIRTIHSSPHQITTRVNVTRREYGGRRFVRKSRDELEGMSLRERQTYAFTSVYGAGVGDGLRNHRALRRDAVLTPEQLWLVYMMCGDVRAAVDSIGRRVSTQNWRVQPTVEPDDELYQDALDQAEAVKTALKKPNAEDDWRSFVVKVTTDALVFWHGAIEKAYAHRSTGARGWITELATPYGPTIHPDVTRDGRWIGYLQDMPGKDGYFGAADKRNGVTRLRLDQIALLRITPNTRSPYPVPIIETIVREVTTLVRASERTMHTMDRHEIPTGFLVLTGMPAKAEDEVEEGLINKAGRDDKVRILHTTGATAPAQWLRVQETFKEVEYREVVHDTRNVIWRNFGVNRIEMGETEDSNRASSQAQIEVGDSHLIEPLLEAWASLINGHIVPAFAQRYHRKRNARVLCEFVFADEEDLSPEEEKLRAEAVRVRIESGQSSINEERKIQGKPPVENGDAIRIKDGGSWVKVGDIREDGKEDTPSEIDGSAEDDDDPEDPEDDPDGDGGDGGDPPDDEGEDGAELARRCGPDCNHDGMSHAVALEIDRISSEAYRSARARRAAELMPSEWQSPSRFDDQRTVDLRRLFDEVLAYGSSVDPHWQAARSASVAAVSSAYRAGRLEGTELRTRLGEILTELRAAWSLETQKHYREAAWIGADAAKEFTGFSGMGDDADERGDLYHSQAMAFLDKLINDLQARMLRNIQAVATAQTLSRSPSVRAESDEREILMAVEGTWDANEHRITNWSGKLIELATASMAALLIWWSGQTDELEPGRVVVEDEPVEVGEPMGPDGEISAAGSTEWWGVWETVAGPGGDDRTCEDCSFESLQGARPLSAFTRYPGGNVQCRANDRCVVTVWTREEVEAGLPIV